MAKWTQRSITDWATQTFGEPDDVETIAERTHEEYEELYEELFGTGSDYINLSKVETECADVVIMIYQLMDFIGANLDDAIDKKMDINSMRSWVKTGNGVGQHT